MLRLYYPDMEVLYSEKSKLLFFCFFFGIIHALFFSNMEDEEDKTELGQKDKHTIELLKIFAAIAAGVIGGSEIIFHGIRSVFSRSRILGTTSLSAMFLGLLFLSLSYAIDKHNTKTDTENINKYLLRKKTKYSTAGIVFFITGAALLLFLLISYCF